MLAHGGEWNGRTVVPRDWVQAATGPQHRGGYGYQVWINPTRQPTFHLRGLRGQFVHVDPASKTVLVQTAVRHSNDGDADSELLSIWRALIGETVP